MDDDVVPLDAVVVVVVATAVVVGVEGTSISEDADDGSCCGDGITKF